jgi:FtsP/CotA-like multicopper oxidase with cupredoxin domain
MNRRDFLSQGGAAVVGAAVLRRRPPAPTEPDFTLRIAPTTLEIAPGKTVRTVAYNGSVPGPVIRLREGVPATIEVVNDSDRDEFVHWHGLHVPAEVDGAMEQGTPPVPAHGRQSYTFVPRPAGTRWYHSHAIAGRDFSRGTYSGQFGFFLVTPASDPWSDRYDDEVFLTMHDWNPYIMGGDDGFQSVGYNHSTINGRRLGFGEPIRVRERDRVLVHVLNSSATDAHWLVLPGHRFTVLALDGNPVPTQASVDQLLLNPGERIDAVIEMNAPGVWVLGEPRDSMREKGLGIVVEYAGRSDEPAWVKPSALRWSYLDFARADSEPGSEAVVRIPLVFKSVFKGHGAFEHWSINGKSYPNTDVIPIENGTRYRLVFDNRSDEDHPVHLHRHSLEIRRIGNVATGGILKDVVTVPAHTVVEADFTANNAGKTLFHCHLQDHMDAGFMTLFECR